MSNLTFESDKRHVDHTAYRFLCNQQYLRRFHTNTEFKRLQLTETFSNIKNVLNPYTHTHTHISTTPRIARTQRPPQTYTITQVRTATFLPALRRTVLNLCDSI